MNFILNSTNEKIYNTKHLKEQQRNMKNNEIYNYQWLFS